MSKSKYVKLSEVAENLGISVHTARSWVKNGRIPEQTYYQVGNTYRFNFQMIEDHILGKKKLEPVQDWSDLKDAKEDIEEDIEDVGDSVEDAEDESAEEPVSLHNLFK